MDPVLGLVLQIAVIGAGAIVVYVVVTRLTSVAARRAGVAANEIRQVEDAFKIIFIVIAGFWMFSVLGVTSLFTTLTFSALAGLAISLALQSTLSNIIAGLFMIEDHTLRLGDRVLFGGIRGRVVKMGFRNTWLEDEAGNIVVVANNNLINGPITNYSAAVRLKAKIFLPDDGGTDAEVQGRA